MIVGSWVQTTALLNVRTSPGLTSPLAGAPHPVGSRGRITGGPVIIAPHTWWQIDYLTGADGWSAGTWLMPDTALEILLNPVTPIGITPYDLQHLEQAAAWEGADTETSLAYFYDGALTNYLLHARTGDSRWLTRAHALGQSMGDYAAVTLDSEGRSSMAPRDFSTLGMAVHYLLTGYPNSLAGVRAQAAGGNHYFTPYGPLDPAYSPDARESAYSVMAMLASTLIPGGPDYTSVLLADLNSYLTFQGQDQTSPQDQPNSGWQSWSNFVSPPGFFVSNYMSGLVAEALILYDRVIGDPRIVPALKTWVDWMWATQWVPLGGGPPSPEAENGVGYPGDQTGPGIGAFQYHTSFLPLSGGGTLLVMKNSNRNQINLSGMILPAFGYLYAKGQGAQYKTQGDTILASLTPATFPDVKQFNQQFRSSPRYLGWAGSTAPAATTIRVTGQEPVSVEVNGVTWVHP